MAALANSYWESRTGNLRNRPMPQFPHLSDEKSHAYLKGLLGGIQGQKHIQL